MRDLAALFKTRLRSSTYGRAVTPTRDTRRSMRKPSLCCAARPDGGRRKAAIIATGELIERNGRLLAYVAPWFGGGASDPLPPRDNPDRRTFNLDMVATGWAAMFLIYPSIPRNTDLRLLLEAADDAWSKRLGGWAEFGEDFLLAYEWVRSFLSELRVLQATDFLSAGAGGLLL